MLYLQVNDFAKSANAKPLTLTALQESFNACHGPTPDLKKI